MDPVTAVFDEVAATAPEIRDSLPGRRVASGDENPSGETQLEADAHADELLAERIERIDGIATYASEERESVRDVGNGGHVGDGGDEGDVGDRGAIGDDGLHVSADPLDGSSNLKSNNAMGTIVGIYDEPLPTGGRNLVAACYVLYGPITTMIVARDGVVDEEVIRSGATSEVDEATTEAGSAVIEASATTTEDGVSEAERDVVTEDLSLPRNPTVYGFGGRVPDWHPEFHEYVQEIETELKLRYGGAMVGDVNQILTYGGIFAYPALESAPDGKLRLQFEANPIAYIVESAGGASSTGDGSILDAEPEALHQRTPVHVGNEALIERLEAALS